MICGPDKPLSVPTYDVIYATANYIAAEQHTPAHHKLTKNRNFVSSIMKEILLFTTLVTLLTTTLASQDVIVHLNHGDIRGEIMTDANGSPFYSFRGIPYAEAPIDQRRFKPPVPKSPWDGVLDATDDGPSCPQIHLFQGTGFEGTEDNCLTINVYTPVLPEENKPANLDVIFHIPGGGFMFGEGGSKTYGPKRFMQKDKDIILVSVTYRVSIFGFLNTDDPSSTGNYGLLDQLEGLRWVRDNIDRFGGDPQKVTLMGESAGGASVIYHLLSPLSKGLFHKAVAMSGTPLDPWAFQPTPLHWAQRVAKEVGCPEDKTKIADCFRKIDAKLLAEHSIFTLMNLNHIHFAPSVDNYFLPDTPYNIIKHKQYNDVPILMGVTKDEGDGFVTRGQFPKDEYSPNDVFNSLVNAVSYIPNNDKVVQKVMNKYFPKKHSYQKDELIATLRQIFTEGSFQNYMYQTAKMMAKKGSQVYFYSYDYEGEAHVLNNLHQDGSKFGVSHATDMFMFFEGSLFGLAKLETEASQQVKEKFQKAVTNLAKTGNPNSDNEKPVWPKCNGSKKLDIYHIDDKCSLSVLDLDHNDAYKFWTKEITKATKEVLAKKKAKEEL